MHYERSTEHASREVGVKNGSRGPICYWSQESPAEGEDTSGTKKRHQKQYGREGKTEESGPRLGGPMPQEKKPRVRMLYEDGGRKKVKDRLATYQRRPMGGKGSHLS